MNKYQEALDYIYAQATYYTNNDEADVAKQIIQELVNKETPKKPMQQTFKQAFKPHNFVNLNFCPVCRDRIEVGRCCSNNDCRQAIDWSEDE